MNVLPSKYKIRIYSIGGPLFTSYRHKVYEYIYIYKAQRFISLFLWKFSLQLHSQGQVICA